MVKANTSKFAIFISICICFVLTLIPLPNEIMHFRPNWITCMLLFWCIYHPEHIGVITAAMIGLCKDILVGDLLGLNTLTCAVAVYLGLELHKRIRAFPRWKQSLVVLVIVGIEMLVQLQIKNILQQGAQSWWYWLPAVSTALFWPLLYWLMQQYGRYFRL